jgi:hypothetical protein
MPGPRTSGSNGLPAKDGPDGLAAVVRTWQAVEAATIERANEAIARTRNPLVELVMEIIRQDCEMHRRVQQVLVDSLERQALALTPEERREVWDLIEMRAEMERYTTELGRRARENCRLFVRTHLLAHLSGNEALGPIEDFEGMRSHAVI